MAASLGVLFNSNLARLAEGIVRTKQRFGGKAAREKYRRPLGSVSRAPRRAAEREVPGSNPVTRSSTRGLKTTEVKLLPLLDICIWLDLHASQGSDDSVEMTVPSPIWGRKRTTENITNPGCDHPQCQRVVGLA